MALRIDVPDDITNIVDEWAKSIHHSYIQLVIQRCLPTHREYRYRITSTKNRAVDDANQQRLDGDYRQAYINYRISRALYNNSEDMQTAIELLEAKLSFGVYRNVSESLEFNIFKRWVNNEIKKYRS